jgi:hypothetical protein
VSKEADLKSGDGRFQQRTFPLGAKLGFAWDKALALADAIEDAEICRKLTRPH